MIYRFGYAYALLLMALGVVFFTVSMLLHISVLIGAKEPFAEFGMIFFRGSIIVGALAAAFLKDGLRWIDQIKSCPEWFWKGALALGLYGIAMTCLQMLFVHGPSFSDLRLALSGFPLGVDAISFCIFYSVLWSGYLDKSEFIKRAGASVVMLAMCIMVFLVGAPKP